jgi:hypothetical protein
MPAQPYPPRSCEPRHGAEHKLEELENYQARVRGVIEPLTEALLLHRPADAAQFIVRSLGGGTEALAGAARFDQVLRQISSLQRDLEVSGAVKQVQALQRGRVARKGVMERRQQTAAATQVQAMQRGRARASEIKQTREAAIFAWAADGADFLDRASLNRLKKAAPVAMLRGRAGFVTHGPDTDGYIHVSWCGDCTQDSRQDYLQTADLDEPLDEVPEEAWKALCDKHDADEAQGLDLAAFTKVLSEWPGGTDTIAKLYSQTPAWLVEVAPVIFAWAAGGADCLDHTSLNRLKKAVPVAAQDGRAGVVTVGAPG